MFDASHFLTRVFLGNAYWQWAAASALVLGVFGASLLFRRFVRTRYQRLLETERVELMELPFEVASKTATPFLLTVALFVGAGVLRVPPEAKKLLGAGFTVVCFWQLGLWASTAVVAWVVARRKTAPEDRATFGTLGIVGFICRMLVWALMLLLTLDNLGVDITALVAGLGVGGIAVALAVQNVLGDLFASLSITLDRPFVIGDFVIVDDYMGSVEQIGVKSTRLRSLGGEQIILANTDLLKSRLRNYGRMMERRVVFKLRVTYETSRNKLHAIPAMLRTIVERQECCRFDRSHFASYGSFALEFETVYYVLSPDYNRYMDVQQTIYFAIHEAFERDGIEFAYPTQKLWLREEQPTTARHAPLQDGLPS